MTEIHQVEAPRHEEDKLKRGKISFPYEVFQSFREGPTSSPLMKMNARTNHFKENSDVHKVISTSHDEVEDNS